MSVVMLARIEYIKTRRRMAFLITSLMLTTLIFLIISGSWQNARRKPELPPFAFPLAWTQILSDPAQISLFFGGVIIVLLVAAEFSWRTARQNVIDGLSKNQWFAAQLLLVLGVAALYQLLVLGIGVAFAATTPFTVFMRPLDLHMLGGYTLAILGFCSMALFLALTVRNAGPALGVLLLWSMLLERVIGMVLLKINKEWAFIPAHFPVRVLTDLVDARNWDPEVARQAAAARHVPMAPMPDMGVLCAFAGAYIGTFIVLSYVSFRRRDL